MIEELTAAKAEREKEEEEDKKAGEKADDELSVQGDLRRDFGIRFADKIKN